MDPITLAIVTSLLGNLGYDGIKKAYVALKTALEHKYGSKSHIIETINKLEQKPKSKTRQGELKKEITNAKAEQDPKLIQTANELLEKIKELSGSKTKINQEIKISGNRNIVTGQGDVTINE